MEENHALYLIIAYEEKINEWELNISKLKADIIVRDERRVNLSKQHANNRANIERYVLIVCIYLWFKWHYNF